ncbi:MAG: helix-turn-helix domain-containing protein [Hyphomicrobiaceae bacterium]
MGKYAAFGLLLSRLRTQAGLSQSDLAKRLDVGQQTVSRWEGGKSRPRYDEVGTIAAAVGGDLPELLAAAGYRTEKAAIATFDAPFPIDSLSSDGFERFLLHFLAARFPDAKVHRLGSQGHTQDGADLEVTFPDGRVWTFQGKRVEEFGPQKVAAAVAKHTRKAEKKFLVLSRTASPKARSALAEHDGWDLWDREDVSREIRSLPTEEQRALVDIFFRGQRLALLGESEPGPWLTTAKFYAPFTEHTSAFNHSWQLVGRTLELDKVRQAMKDSAISALMVVAPAGVGKTRLLRTAVEEFEAARSGTLVRFLSQSEAATGKSLEDLGSGPKLLVIDDAHEREDLSLLFRYAADPGNQAKLVLSLRPYGRPLITAQAGKFALTGERTGEVMLDWLSLKEATELARQVLRKHGGPEVAAENIAQLTRDCPLATVVGAQVVSKERQHLELLTNEKAFREQLMSAFHDVIAGDVGRKADGPQISKLLRFLALVQPFHPEDRTLLKAIREVEGLDEPEAARLIRLLVESGVAFRRGERYRIAPDLLADYIIEKECIGIAGASTGYAEKVFGSVEGTGLENLVVNLGRLDWRRARGDTSNSRLLDGIWAMIRPEHEHGDPYLKAVTSVAFYQPDRALRFVNDQMRQGRFLRHLPEILKYVGYNYGHLGAALEGLWHLGKGDERELGPHTDHAIRILKELCEVEANKPREYIVATVEFGIALMGRSGVWGERNTPLDFLCGALEVDGHSVESSDRRTMTWSHFSVNQSYAAEYRKKVIRLLLDLLSSENRRAALAAASGLDQALRYPMNAPRDGWDREFTETLKAVLGIVRGQELRPAVLLRIVRSVSWHAHHGTGEPAELAQAIIDALPTSLEFRTVLGLVDGHGMLLEKISDFDVVRAKLAEFHQGLAAELQQAHPDAEQLRIVIDAALEEIGAQDAAPFAFMNELMGASPAFAEAVIRDALSASPGETKRYASTALGMTLAKNRELGLRLVGEFCKSGSREHLVDVGGAYAVAGPKALDETDQATLQMLLASDEEEVVLSGLSSMYSLSKTQPRTVIDLITTGNIGLSARVADHALMWLHNDRNVLMEVLGKDDVLALLERLKHVPELKGHWVEEFLALASEKSAEPLARFLMERVEFAAGKSWQEFRASNHGPHGKVPLRFNAAPDFANVLRLVSDWLVAKRNEAYEFRSRAAELFGWMFPFDETLTRALGEWMEVADQAGLELIGQLLSEAPNRFVFSNIAFVARYLERCQQFGKDCYRRGSNNLFSSAVSGMRSGTPGEPFPEDLALRENATAALKGMPPFACGVDLYQGILRYAESSIRQSLRDAEAFDDE